MVNAVVPKESDDELTMIASVIAVREVQATLPWRQRAEDAWAAFAEPLRILLIKPYQPGPVLSYSPPLGLISLASTLRERFGSKVHIDVLDMKVHAHEPQWLVEQLGRTYRPDIVGVSALNCEARASREIADLVKRWRNDTVTVLGGPYALHRADEILGKSRFDWIFNGAADNTFPEAVFRFGAGQSLGTDIPGFSYRDRSGGAHISQAQDAIKDLDKLPLPAWDLLNLDVYTTKPNMMTVLKGQKYAMLFTSRGCPYLCNYCHDLFSKKFVHRSPESVIAEIAWLHEEYGVDEFQIVDDIFNLHKPRLKAIMSEVSRRWPGKLKFTFPNGVRADILDQEVIDALADAGTYAMAIAIETVTPRLQTLIEKHLDIEKTKNAIAMADRRGIMLTGFFMLGFPTETVDEVKATVRFALQSRLTIAHFFVVVPQPETPLFELAREVSPDILAEFNEAEENGVTYRSAFSWYQRAYGFPLSRYVKYANFRFHASPGRVWRILRRVPLKNLLYGMKRLAQIVLSRN